MTPETVTLHEAAERILAAEVRSAEDVPPFDRSRVDGYAVLSSDVRAASPEKPVRLDVAFEVQMGRPAIGSVVAGACARIPTGGALPAGADSVVMREDTIESPSAALVLEPSAPWENITRRGADIRAGDIALPLGAVLQPAALGMLAAVGAERVDVLRRPRVCLIVNGDELVASGRPLRPGEIRDINSFSIAAALRALGCVVIDVAHIADERAALAGAVSAALRDADLIIISGSSSVGDQDHAPEVIAQLARPGVIVHGVRVKPGRPTLLAAAGDVPIIGLPGNPVSALVMFETFVRPTIARMLGRRDEPLRVSATLSQAIARDERVLLRVPVSLRRAGDTWRAEPLLGTSAQMHVLAWADALVDVDPGAGELAAGTRVDAVPLTRGGALR